MNDRNEAEHIRLTTLGKVMVGLRVVAELQQSLALAGLEGEAADLAHAYEALESAAATLRGDDDV